MADLDAVFARANEYYQRGMLAEAGMVCESVLAKSPRHPQALHLLAFVRDQGGRHEEAVRLIAKVVKLNPGNAEALNHQGYFLLRQGLDAQAIASFDRALAIDPGLVEAHINRSNLLQELGRFDDALPGYERVLAIDPGNSNARRNRFVCHVKQIKDIDFTVEEGLAVARANVNQKFAEAEAAGLNGKMSAFRLRHDFEQCSYLKAGGCAIDGLESAHAALQDLCARHLGDGQVPGSLRIDLSSGERAAIEPFRRAMHLHAQQGSIEQYLCEENDWLEIERRYFASSPEIVHIDNFLSPKALAAFWRFCLFSTIWKTEYANQYLGAFFDQGFVSSLHLNVARELQLRMPKIFGGHTLEDSWAFKYDSSMRKGTGVHADFAKVNLNFWITPDEANLDPQSGGLLVYDVPAPKSWAPSEYNWDTAKIYQYLADRRAKAIAVPYRCNRAVLFNSSLFHETDSFRFKEGYESRRINITYLFGKELERDSR